MRDPKPTLVVSGTCDEGSCAGVDGYECRHAQLWGPRVDEPGDPTVRYVMRCTCPCHPSAERPHAYLSTGCLHGLHDKCRVTCKYCPAKCRCICHTSPKDAPKDTS
jgi:hypothetical protein